MTKTNSLVEIVKTGMNGKSNYQKVVICHLSSSKNQIDTIENIYESLMAKNLKDKRDVSHYKGSPVWRVLKDKDIIVKVDGSYQLKGSFSVEDLKEIKKICMESFLN